MTVIADSQYFAPGIFYSALKECTHCIFDIYVLSQKSGFLNRCIVAGANGPIAMSIPLSGGRGQRQSVMDIRIAQSEPWREQHWKTICSAYRRSPWFDQYADELEALYQTQDTWLIDWNFRCHRWICDKLSLAIVSVLSSDYDVSNGKLAGIDTDAALPFHTAAQRDNWDDWRFWLSPRKAVPATERYPQVFEERHGFLPGLSILDWLFCMGANDLPKLRM